MKKHLLNKNQLFSLKRKTLEKRIRKYYFETGDAKDTLEFLLVLQVREELTNDDFSFMMVDIVKHYCAVCLFFSKITLIKKNGKCYHEDYLR